MSALLYRSKVLSFKARLSLRHANFLAVLAKTSIIFALLALFVSAIAALFGASPIIPAILALLLFLVAGPALIAAYGFAAHAETLTRRSQSLLHSACLRGEASWDGVRLHGWPDFFVAPKPTVASTAVIAPSWDSTSSNSD